MEKTVGFQPRYHLNTYIIKVEALFQCLHSFFIRLSLNATAPVRKNEKINPRGFAIICKVFGFCIAFFMCFFGIRREISLFFYGKA